MLNIGVYGVDAAGPAATLSFFFFIDFFTFTGAIEASFLILVTGKLMIVTVRTHSLVMKVNS